jgi:hypothetical protein
MRGGCGGICPRSAAEAQSAAALKVTSAPTNDRRIPMGDEGKDRGFFIKGFWRRADHPRSREELSTERAIRLTHRTLAGDYRESGGPRVVD